jgi:outer membrane protease
MRDLTFEEEFDGGDFYAYGAEATYDLTDALFITCAIDMQEIPEFTGDMTVTDDITGVEQKSSDTAGIGSSLMAISASVGIKF